MDKNYKKVFNAITEFVEDLWEEYGHQSGSRKVTPLSLYHRLIDHIKETDYNAIEKAVDGFEKFFSKYEKLILDGNLSDLPRGTIIQYGSSAKINIEIQKYVYLGNQETKVIIEEHLLTIIAILSPNKEKMEEIEKRMEKLQIDKTTNEGQFIQGIMEKAKDAVENTNIDSNNPSVAIMGLLQSGVIQDMVGGLQEGIESGNMDLTSLLTGMQNAIGSMMPPQNQMQSHTQRNAIVISEPIIEEITDDKSQIL